MLALDIDFQAKLVTYATTSEQNVLSEDKGEPRVWFQRRPSEQELFLSGAMGLNRVNYDVEVSGLDIDATATLAETVRVGLHGFRGTMGGTNVLSIFVSDVTDDYLFKSAMNDDTGMNVVGFAVEIVF